MPTRNSFATGSSNGRTLLLAVLLQASLTHAATDLTFDSAEHVNEGSLTFLQSAPARPVHHHQNHIRIHADSLTSGWVSLSQCHDNLDAVPSLQITFRENFVRDLKVVSADRIGQAWVEGPSVQLLNIEPGARLCLSALTRALRNTGNGYFNLSSGPYMRKFLDGYYPMRVSLDIDYPVTHLRLIDIAPPAQPGLVLDKRPGTLHLDALFAGELQFLIQFDTP